MYIIPQIDSEINNLFHKKRIIFANYSRLFLRIIRVYFCELFALILTIICILFSK